MIRISDINIPLEYNDNVILQRVSNQLKINDKSVKSISMYRRSIDARHKNDVHFICTFDVTLNCDENAVISKAKCKNAAITEPYKYNLIKCGKMNYNPVVVGSGPAGLFCALVLAQSGAKPILIERGCDVDTRTKDVDNFWQNGKLNTSSNVQFGEGGAGTFSDGKLNTGTKDTRARHVLNEFVNHGAPKEILYNAKPHIGTDNLKETVKNIRNEIIACGGEVRFCTQLVDIKTNNNKICGAVIKNENATEIIDTDCIVLATGHSARDTFEMLVNNGVLLEPKAFSVGARIEHLREKIDKSQFGSFAGHKNLGAAPYKLNVHLKNGRGVYTFCMCPGGTVVASSSEKGTVVTNGMSYFNRDCANSNSALLVGVTPSDFSSEDPLAGMYFQQKLEQKAFIIGGENYNAPLQRVDDFLSNKKTTKLGEVKPSYTPGITFAKLDDCLPDFITNSMREAIKLMNNRLSGFSDGDSLLTGVETRSSSPVRIIRDNETMECSVISGLYPCGEGAGYAGGIISAAVDGIKCAEKIIYKSINN